MGAFGPGWATGLLTYKLKNLPTNMPEEKKNIQNLLPSVINYDKIKCVIKINLEVNRDWKNI